MGALSVATKVYLRYFATTDDSPVGRMALEYLRSLLRIGPVRVLTMSGGLQGAWSGYAQLLATPISIPYVNIVGCVPERWIWTQRITMHPQDMSPMSGTPASRARPKEITTSKVELYTDGIRNVLFAGLPPNEPDQMATSLRYEALIVPAAALREPWQQEGRSPTLVPVPVIEHDTIRAAVLDC